MTDRMNEALELVLTRGDAVLVPTECGYVVAARADSDPPMARIRELLPSAEDPPTLLEANGERADRWVAEWLAPSMRLRRRYWPGPLTLVLPASPDVPATVRLQFSGDPRAWIPLLVPAFAPLGEALRRLPFPIAGVPAPARPGAGGTATRLEDLDPAVAARLPVHLGAAPRAVAQRPAVVRVGAGVFDVLREGLLTAADLRRTAGVRVLLVCTGNTCRSPMAAAALRAALARKLGRSIPGTPEAQDRFLDLFGYRVASAGVAPWIGAPATPAAVEAAAELGLSLEGHRAQEVTPELLADFDRVYTMGERHRARVLELAPSGLSVERLDPDRDLEDPYGGPLEVYRATLRSIEAALSKRISEL